MFTFVITMIVIVCVLLVLVILAQNSKGGGLSSQFGGSGTSNLIGVKKTGDLLERITWGLAIALVLLSMATNFLIEDQPSGLQSPNIDRAQDQQPLPSLDLGNTDNQPTTVDPNAQPDQEESLENLLEEQNDPEEENN